MPLSAPDIFARLSEWPHRGVGTEEELEAREALITELTGEFDVEVKEEGFNAPTSYLPFLWLIGIMAIIAILGANYMPDIMMMLGALAFVSWFLFFDWRRSPIIWWGANRTTANLVASKGQGKNLFILMAHIDSAPASFAYRANQVPHFRFALFASTCVIALGVVFPLFASFGLNVNGAFISFGAALIALQLLLASMDFWRFGYTPGANDNLSGVAAATAAASRLWRRMPEDSEVRLVITTAEEAGMLGSQHYLNVHKNELKARKTYLVNIDTVGCENLRFVTKSGGFTPVNYQNALTHVADRVCRINQDFERVTPAHHHVGDFDSVWFARAGIPSVTLASYDDYGHMTGIHTPEDTIEKVDTNTMILAARFAEAIVRTCPNS
ncbi:M28 family metallopeptidase [Kordiimonas aquimaris]|uniref:M28 family metallopeptidase n=1 Tax=Kordiimonas aquimaris TaxID=707591 RepID=UPI0021D05308|nr:M28 family metallopeptidase [Kordiimonas aquimaris]